MPCLLAFLCPGFLAGASFAACPLNVLSPGSLEAFFVGRVCAAIFLLHRCVGVGPLLQSPRILNSYILVNSVAFRQDQYRAEGEQRGEDSNG